MASTEDYEDYGQYKDYYENVSLGPNVEPCSLTEVLHFTRLFCPPTYAVVFVLAVLGNVLVLCVVRRYWRSTRGSVSLTDTLLLHLAVSDLLLALTLPLFALQWIHGWQLGPVLCKLAGALFCLNIYCGILFLACISVDRYLAIVHAVGIGWRRNGRVAHAACAAIWAGCLALAGWELRHRVVVPLESDGTLMCRPLVGLRWQVTVQLSSLLLFFGLPLLIMLYCYTRIFRALCRAPRRQKRRSLRLVVVLVLAFVLCWAPYNGLRLVETLLALGVLRHSCTLDHSLDVGLLLAESLGLAHCALNPLLYGLVGVKFRRELAQMGKAALAPRCLGLEGWARAQRSPRRTTGSFSSAESENTYFSIMA